MTSIHKQRMEWLSRRAKHLDLEEEDFIYFNDRVTEEVTEEVRRCTETEARNLVFERYFA